MLKGLGNLANLGSLLKQAQQMGSRLQGLNDELKGKRTTGTAGGGMVTVEANGIGEILACRIDPSLITSGDRELVEDLLPAAINQAIAKSKELHAQALQGMTAGLEIPGLAELLQPGDKSDEK